MRRVFLIAMAMAVVVMAGAAAAAAAMDFVKVSHHRSQIRRSFAFSHRGFGERMDDVRLLGNAAVMADGSIRIPMQDHVANQAGRALFASPVRMWDPNTSVPASFDTEFSFAIGSAAGAGASGEASGGGLAFVIVPDEISVGRGAGFMGMLNEAPPSNLCDKKLRKNSDEFQRHAVIAIEFDTFKDAEFGDPNDNHVGINLGSVVSDATADLANAGVYLRNASLVRARIVYDGASQELQVHVSPESASPSSTPLLTAPIDLSGFLREYMFVGFSAATGSESRSHSIFRWNFSCASHAVQRFPVDLQPRAHGASECNESMLEHEFEQSNKTKRPPRAFVIFLAVSAVVILALVGLFILWHSSGGGSRGSKVAAAAAEAAIQVAPPLIPRPRPLHRPRRFELPELVAATGDFDDRQRIGGDGASGGVYRAALQDGSIVAVKRLQSNAAVKSWWWLTARRRERRERAAFVAAMSAGSKLRHPNLVPLRGWCYSPRRRAATMLVVYDYMPNGSLDKWLYPGEAIATLPWLHRWKVACDVAAGLAHLHARRLPHGRLKASNVLLDITFRARLGDYGLAFFSNGGGDEALARLDDDRILAADVAALGVVLLELTRGTPLLDLALVLQQCREETELDKLVDCRLAGDYCRQQAACLLGVGFLCAQKDRDRPSMDAVLELLDRMVPVFSSTTVNTSGSVDWPPDDADQPRSPTVKRSLIRHADQCVT